MITFNGQPVVNSGYCDSDLYGSVQKVKVKCWASPARSRDLGASKARQNRDDDKVWSDGKWDLR